MSQRRAMLFLQEHEFDTPQPNQRRLADHLGVTFQRAHQLMVALRKKGRIHYENWEQGYSIMRPLTGEHYVPCVFAYDASWVDRARRAGTLDGFHGYPEQSHVGKSEAEQAAYKSGYAHGKKERP